MRTAIVLSAVLSSGCATKHPGTYEVADATGSTDFEAAKSAADELWVQRDDKTKLSAALAKYEEAYNADPRDRDTAVKLTRGWYFLGDAYASDKDEKLANWEQAITWGKRCMALNTDFTALLEKGDETEGSAVRVATVEDVPCIYWTASALGKWAKLSGLAKTLKHIGTVKAYVLRAQELDATYFYHAPDRYWGAYYAAIPSFAGKDLDKSKQHFDVSIGGSPEYVGTKVLLAEYWAVQQQDINTFISTLNEVLSFDPYSIPDITPEILAEQSKARNLMDQRGDLFADPGAATVTPLDTTAPPPKKPTATAEAAPEEGSEDGEAADGDAAEGDDAGDAKPTATAESAAKPTASSETEGKPSTSSETEAADKDADDDKAE